MNRDNPFRRKWTIITPRDWFPWVDVACFEDGDPPYLHVKNCKDCKRTCNERGIAMGKQYKWWKEGKTCAPRNWGPKKRFTFDN